MERLYKIVWFEEVTDSRRCKAAEGFEREKENFGLRHKDLGSNKYTRKHQNCPEHLDLDQNIDINDIYDKMLTV